MPKRLRVDRWLFFVVVFLAVGGVGMVASASPYVALREHNSTEAFYLRQALFAAAGLIVLLVSQSLPYRWLARRWVVMSLLGGCALLLLAVLTQDPVGGARRWIQFGPIRVQPSELVKPVVVVFMAWMLARKEDRIGEPTRLAIPGLVVVGLLASLVLIEPDLGSAVIFVTTACVMLFVAGLRWTHVGVVATLGCGAFAGAVLLEEYRIQRVASFLRTLLDPSPTAEGMQHQLRQSLIAIGSGGLTGVGVGQGHQKAFYVPETHTDFIFSVVGEELGLIGTMAILLAFLLLFWRGMRAATRAPDRFGFYLGLGLTVLLVMQGLVNMGVCVGLLPTKGLSLPFISYGGSSLLVSMAAAGVLLNISQYAD